MIDQIGELVTSKPAIAVGAWMIGVLSKMFFDRRSANTQFDHRLRLEKEYALYSELWERLCDVRRDLTAYIDPLDSPFSKPKLEEVAQRFKAYEELVRRGEPFMDFMVFEDAKSVRELADDIIKNTKIQSSTATGELFTAMTTGQVSNERADLVKRLDLENEELFALFTGLCDSIAHDIKRRVTVA